MTISAQYSEYILGVEFGALDERTVASAQKLILDHLGVSAVGSTTRWGEIVRRVGLRSGGAPEASVYFTPEQVPATVACLINGTYGHGYELDDHILKTHPGCVIIPAALAAAQWRGSVSGPDLITAVVVGYETLIRLSEVMDNATHAMTSTGHHPTGSLAQFGAAAAIGKILDLNVDQMVSALGLAGNFPTGVCEFYRGTMEKRLFAGRAAESGMLACQLAADGFTGPDTIFEGEFGFCRTFAHQPYPERMVVNLGSGFRISDVEIKRYACCGGNIDWIDAGAMARQTHPELGDGLVNVDSIMIESSSKGLGPLRTSIDVHEIMAAQYSVPYAVAISLCRGKPGLKDFSTDGYGDEMVQRALKLCTVVRHDVGRGKGPVTITLSDGRRITIPVPHRWDVIGELDESVVRAKFLDVTADVLSTARAYRVIEAVSALPDSADTTALTTALS